jgi:hypothetical protein
LSSIPEYSRESGVSGSPPEFRFEAAAIEPGRFSIVDNSFNSD